MTKHCPNCGNELDEKEMKCPECGFVFSKDKEKNENEEATTAAEQEDSLHHTENNSSHFTADDQNENIEWADLKDLSIGHVMDLFNEQQGQTEGENTPADKTVDTIEETNQAEGEKDKTEDENDSDDPEAKTPTEEKKESAEIKSEELLSGDIEEHVEADLLSTASLQEYIDAHKEEQESAEIDSTVASIAELVSEEDRESEAPSDSGPTETQTDEANQEQEASLNEEATSEEEQEEAPSGISELRKRIGEIPSKSKKPEEIEMDAAPIFFEEKDIMPSEFGPKKKSQFATFDNAERPKVTPSETSLEKKNKKIPVFVAAAAVLALGAGGWYYTQTQSSGEKPTTTVSSSEKSLLDETETALNNYFTDDKHEFIKSDMVSVSTESLEADLEKLKDEDGYTDLEKTLSTIKEKQAIINKVNELYVSPVISGSSYKEAAIASDKEVTLEKESGTDEFSKLINQAIDNAETQYDQLEKAKNAVDVIYKDGQARSLLSQETYEAAVTEVNKVKNEELKKPLTASLSSAKAALSGETADSTESADGQENTAESTDSTPDTSADEVNASTDAPAAEANTAVDPSAFTGPDSNGVYTSPVYTAIPEHVADTGNAAWVWAAGIKEKVIATCIERGYIVDGGYYLEPARIVNGQGYYNLYKTDGTYLVTINAQTGWFKGNASRNAGR